MTTIVKIKNVWNISLKCKKLKAKAWGHHETTLLSASTFKTSGMRGSMRSTE